MGRAGAGKDSDRSGGHRAGVRGGLVRHRSLCVLCVLLVGLFFLSDADRPGRFYSHILFLPCARVSGLSAEPRSSHLLILFPAVESASIFKRARSDCPISDSTADRARFPMSVGAELGEEVVRRGWCFGGGKENCSEGLDADEVVRDSWGVGDERS